MKKHYFFELNSNRLEMLKEEYFSTSVSLFSKKYNISNKSLIILFGKKGMSGKVGRKIKLQPQQIIRCNTVNKLNGDFFKKGLYKTNQDNYYENLFNKHNFY